MTSIYSYYYSTRINDITYNIDFNIYAPVGCTDEMLDAHAKDVLSSIVQNVEDWVLDEVVELGVK